MALRERIMKLEANAGLNDGSVPIRCIRLRHRDEPIAAGIARWKERHGLAKDHPVLFSGRVIVIPDKRPAGETATVKPTE
jgi:hypothetical protein